MSPPGQTDIETFSALTRRCSFHSIVDQQAAINRYIAEHSADAKPLVGTRSAEEILAKVIV